jgi:hypothetical protein
MAITLPAIMKALAAPSPTGTGPGPVNVNRRGTLRRDWEHVTEGNRAPKGTETVRDEGVRGSNPLTPTSGAPLRLGGAGVVQW